MVFQAPLHDPVPRKSCWRPHPWLRGRARASCKFNGLVACVEVTTHLHSSQSTVCDVRRRSGGWCGWWGRTTGLVEGPCGLVGVLKHSSMLVWPFGMAFGALCESYAQHVFDAVTTGVGRTRRNCQLTLREHTARRLCLAEGCRRWEECVGSGLAQPTALLPGAAALPLENNVRVPRPRGLGGFNF